MVQSYEDDEIRGQCRRFFHEEFCEDIIAVCAISGGVGADSIPLYVSKAGFKDSKDILKTVGEDRLSLKLMMCIVFLEPIVYLSLKEKGGLQLHVFSQV